MSIKLEANAKLDLEGAVAFVGVLANKSFEPPPFSWAAMVVVVDTTGPDGGYGSHAYFYHRDGRWFLARHVAGEKFPDDEFYDWIENTYDAVGEWAACMIEIIRENDDMRAALEFEFEDIDRWEVDGANEPGDIFRPKHLPVPLKSARYT